MGILTCSLLKSWCKCQRWTVRGLGWGLNNLVTYWNKNDRYTLGRYWLNSSNTTYSNTNTGLLMYYGLVQTWNRCGEGTLFLYVGWISRVLSHCECVRFGIIHWKKEAFISTHTPSFPLPLRSVDSVDRLAVAHINFKGCWASLGMFILTHSTDRHTHIAMMWSLLLPVKLHGTGTESICALMSKCVCAYISAQSQPECVCL